MAGDESDLVAALRAGDEAAFARLVDDWSRPMLMLARGFVSTEASAEEVVQDTWLAVIKGLDRFEGRSSLRTWVYRILVNTAKSRGVREHRTLRGAAVAGEDAGPSLDPALFQDGGLAGGTVVVAGRGRGRGLGAGRRGTPRAAHRLDTLPERQRVVVTLRDVLGHSSEEVCTMLEISQANQRVLLHRARTAVRAALAAYLEGS